MPKHYHISNLGSVHHLEFDWKCIFDNSAARGSLHFNTLAGGDSL